MDFHHFHLKTRRRKAQIWQMAKDNVIRQFAIRTIRRDQEGTTARGMQPHIICFTAHNVIWIKKKDGRI